MRKYVLKNLPFKLVSLAIAIMLWWAVGRDQPIEIPMTVPLEFQHAPGNLEINSDYPFQARLTLARAGALAAAAEPSEVHAILDLHGAGPGERTFDLTPSDIHVPRNVKVVQIVPSQFHISFDRSATRIGAGAAARDWHLVERIWHNRCDSRSGHHHHRRPGTRVDAIQAAITDPVDATGVVGKATFTTHAYVADPLVRVQTPGRST